MFTRVKTSMGTMITIIKISTSLGIVENFINNLPELKIENKCRSFCLVKKFPHCPF